MADSANKYTLIPVLLEKFGGIVWKVEADSENGLVAVETRNPDDRTAAISAFDYRSGKCLFREFRVEDSWSWHLDKIYRNTIFLHGYLSPQSPEHKGIIAITTAGSIAWQRFNQTLLRVTSKGLILFNPALQPRSYELTDEAGNLAERNPANMESLVQPITLPQVSGPEAFAHLLPHDVAGPVWSCTLPDTLILAFHTGVPGSFRQELRIFRGGELAGSEILAAAIQKMNPEAFFLIERHLFCIRGGNREFVSYLV
jgi:hypothetical protein